VSLGTPCDPQWARGQFSVLSGFFLLFPLSLALKKKKNNLFQVSCLKHKKNNRKSFHFSLVSSWVSYFAC
jgi:hypothetical protein